MRSYLFIVTLAALLIAIGWVTVHYTLLARRRSSGSWQELLDRLAKINHENVALVALDLIDEDGRVRGQEWPELSADQIWNLVGGMEGLEKIEANCRVLIDIAVYVQITYPEAILVAEELRRNTRHIQWHVNRLRAGSQTGNLRSSFTTYAQRAVASYYLMTKEIIALCEKSNFAGTEQLRAAV